MLSPVLKMLEPFIIMSPLSQVARNMSCYAIHGNQIHHLFSLEVRQGANFSINGAFCINCVLFAWETTQNSSKLINLFKLPLNDWANACQRLKDHHSKSEVHATDTFRAGQFKKCMENKVTPINVQYDKAISAQMQLNREKLKPIIKGVIPCGRQNFGLQGHRDDAKHHDE